MSPGCPQDVRKMSQDVPMMSPRCHQVVPNLSARCPQDVVKMSPITRGSVVQNHAPPVTPPRRPLEGARFSQKNPWVATGGGARIKLGRYGDIIVSPSKLSTRNSRTPSTAVPYRIVLPSSIIYISERPRRQGSRVCSQWFCIMISISFFG